MAGRPPKEKSFANMLRIAAMSPGKDGVPKLREIAEKLVEQAIQGEGWAVKEIADRLDGKVPQAVVGGDEDTDPIRMLHRIERVIVDPANPNGAGIPAAPEASSI